MKHQIAISVLLVSALAACGEAPSGADSEVSSSPAQGLSSQRLASSEQAAVTILSPANGSIVTSPFEVRFGISEMAVSPAGVEKANAGHHHLLIDVDQLPNLNLPVPKDDNHRHFGGGQTNVSLSLAPGMHTLQLLLADHNHLPHNPAVLSEQITVTVEESK
jgi:hypothetical protein